MDRADGGGGGGGTSRPSAGGASPPSRDAAQSCATHRRGKMAAAESSDSEEEDLVSYGTALQPLQEGKGPQGARLAPPRYLRHSLRRALGSSAGRGGSPA